VLDVTALESLDSRSGCGPASTVVAATTPREGETGVSRAHHYEVSVQWRGNRGTGTSSYDDYSRDHEVLADGKPPILASSDPAFLGDDSRWNPEEMLVGSLSQCHMLWYLHLAAVNGVVVVDYTDSAVGTMAEDVTGAVAFTEVELRPAVVVAEPSMCERAEQLHEEARNMCFVARSVKFPVTHQGTVVAREIAAAR